MPNNLPLNWYECKLEDLCEVISKGSTPKNQTEKPNWAKILKAENITKESIIDSTSCKYIDKETHTTTLKRSILKKNDILITIAGTLGRCAVVETEENLNTNQAVCFVRLLNCGISPHFIKYYALSPVVNNGLTGKAKITAIPNLTLEVIKNIDVVLPPLAEQERIVEKIEALFQDIDEGVEHLKSAQAQIKQYRQSVLKSAFEGKLYKTTDWKEKKLIDLTSKIGSGSTPNGGKNNYHTDGIPIIRSMNVHMNKFIYEGLAYLDDKQASQLNNVITQKDDVLLNITGASIGRTCLLPDTLVGARVNQHVSIVRTKNELLPQYLSFYFASPIMQTKITIENYGATRQALTKSAIENFIIQLPTLPEQQRIVEEIEKRFAVVDELEKAVNEGLEKADKLKQSILKKAFEGKLVAQNPNDEPASILLARIKKSQSPTKGKKK